MIVCLRARVRKQPIIALYFESDTVLNVYNLEAWPRGHKTFFMLSSAEHELYPAQNVKIPTIVGILTFISMINTTSERLKARTFLICRYFSLYEQLKFRAQMN